MAKTATGDSLLKMDEAQLVELSNGDVMANMRNDIPQTDNSNDNGGIASTHYRGVALSTDGGATWGNVTFDHGLPEPVCMGSIIRASPPMSDGAVFFSNPGSATAGRVVGRVRRSEHCTGLPPSDCTWGDGSFTVYPEGDFAYVDFY
jgi:hypothetical protein